MIVLMLLMLMLLEMSGKIQGIWGMARNRIDATQIARALFIQMERELATVVSEPAQFGGDAYDIQYAAWRFVQNPDLPSGVILPGTDSLFWQTSVVDTPVGDISNVGYFVNPERQLVRFFAAPNIESRFPELGPDDAYGLNRVIPSRPALSDDSTWWGWILPNPSPSNFQPEISGQPSKVVSVLGEGVAGLWFRCHDVESEPIPVTRVAAAGTPMRYDSAHLPTLRRLPGSVECVVAIFEPSTLSKFRDQITATFPVQQALSASNSDSELLQSVDDLISACVDAGIPAPKVFRANFKLPPGNYRP